MKNWRQSAFQWNLSVGKAKANKKTGGILMEKTKPKKLHLTVKILIGLIAGIIVGVILNLTNQA